MKYLLNYSLTKKQYCFLSYATIMKQVITHYICISQHSTIKLGTVSVPDVITGGSPDVVIQYYYTSFSVMIHVHLSHGHIWCTIIVIFIYSIHVHVLKQNVNCQNNVKQWTNKLWFIWQPRPILVTKTTVKWLRCITEKSKSLCHGYNTLSGFHLHDALIHDILIASKPFT